MSQRWEDKSLKEQALIITECFPGLADKTRQKLLSEWGENSYPDSWTGHCMAMADLQSLCETAVMSDKQKEDRRQRLKEQVDKWLSK